MRLTRTDFGGAKCVECKQEKATNLLRLFKNIESKSYFEYIYKLLFSYENQIIRK